MISSPKSAREILDLYFLENRARLLEIASFLDRIDRAKDSAEAKADFMYKAFIEALKLLLETDENRTKAIQLLFSDLSTGPIESAVGLKAVGAWEGSMV
jgi:hypothetical protein